MCELKRRSVLAALGGALVTGGCVSDSNGGRGSDESTTDHRQGTTQTTDLDEKTTTDETSTTGDWISHASNTPNPDHSITLRNENDEIKIVRLRIVREATGKTVYDKTHELSAGGGVHAYNLKQADPDGVEAFSVCGELVGDALTATETHTSSSRGESDKSDSPRRGCATIRTSQCYGDAHVTVRDDEVQVVYAIC
ncbi:hypothetical protein [Haladaptatus sp. NG-SE-30]